MNNALDQKSSITISLIIPAYNEEKYIGECLTHALENADGKFLEIIVIDNASNDNTNVVASGFPGVRVVREEKKGVTRARQRGFLEAKGEVLAFVDADTRMPEGWARTVAEEFGKNMSLACLSGPYIYHDTPQHKQFLAKWFYWRLLAMPSYLVIGYMAVGGNFAIRRDVVEKMGGFDTRIEFYGEDTNTARRAREFGKVKFMLSLAMPTSGRRLESEGFFKVAIIYMLNFLSEAFLKRPYSHSYKDIR